MIHDNSGKAEDSDEIIPRIELFMLTFDSFITIMLRYKKLFLPSIPVRYYENY